MEKNNDKLTTISTARWLKVLDAIKNLTQVIQSGNIRMGGFPAPVTPDDPGQILANIINPPAKTGKK